MSGKSSLFGFDYLCWFAFGWAPCIVVGAFAVSIISLVIGLFSYAFGGDFMIFSDYMLGRLFAASGALLYLIGSIVIFVIKPNQH